MLLEERCLFLRRSAIAELPGAMMSKTQGKMWPKTLALWASCSVSHNTSAWTREAAGHPDGETLQCFLLYMQINMRICHRYWLIISPIQFVDLRNRLFAITDFHTKHTSVYSFS